MEKLDIEKYSNGAGIRQENAFDILPAVLGNAFSGWICPIEVRPA